MWMSSLLLVGAFQFMQDNELRVTKTIFGAEGDQRCVLHSSHKNRL